MIHAAKLALVGVFCLSVASGSHLVNGDSTGSEPIANNESSSFWSTLFGSFKPKHLPESNYGQEYNDIDYDPESIDRMVPVPAASSYTSTSLNSPSKTTPALSALTLLGFLYFLGYIQDVLQGNSVRRKRDTTSEADLGSNPPVDSRVESYLRSLEEVIDTLKVFFPEDDSPNQKFLRSGKTMDDTSSIASSAVDGIEKDAADNEITGRSTDDATSGRALELRADKIVNFIGSLLGKIPRMLGITKKKKKASRRDDYQISNLEADSADPGFWSMFGSKIGQIATLMDFLDNPSPMRIGKTNWEEERDDEIEDEDLMATPTELGAEDRSFLVPHGDAENRNFMAPQRPNWGGQRSRQKRFTDEMNAWYSEAGQDRHRASEGSGANGKILGLVFNLLKGALTS